MNIGDIYECVCDGSMWIVVGGKINKNYSKCYYLTGELGTIKHLIRRYVTKTKNIKHKNLNWFYIQTYELKKMEKKYKYKTIEDINS